MHACVLCLAGKVPSLDTNQLPQVDELSQMQSNLVATLDVR